MAGSIMLAGWCAESSIELLADSVNKNMGCASSPCRSATGMMRMLTQHAKHSPAFIAFVNREFTHQTVF